MRLYSELQQVIDRSTVVIGDGGDFVSYAGRVIETYEPGCWMDPGPYGCLGSGPGYAIAAKLAHPTARSASCSATARSGSPGSSSTRWCGTGCRSSA
jgi:thiamine pyrophosphate-dependent acetolactate synthase large subunit-like protein